MKRYCIIRVADNSKINPTEIPNICLPGSKNCIAPNDLVITDAQSIITKPHRWLGMVDRAKSKLEWWSYDINLLKIFNSIEDAQKCLDKLHYGNLSIVEFDEAIQKLPYWHYSIKDMDGESHEFKIGIDLADGKDKASKMLIDVKTGEVKPLPTWML